MAGYARAHVPGCITCARVANVLILEAICDHTSVLTLHEGYVCK